MSLLPRFHKPMPTPTSSTLLHTSHLSATFQSSNGGLHVLDDINFKVEEHQFVCVLGPSGSGKSTLLRVLAGLLEPSYGEVRLSGQLVRGPQEGVAMVFQNANLMPWRSVCQNIRLPLELAGVKPGEAAARSQELVELVGLQGFEDVLPQDLSGGMAQRVAIARALVQDPDLLLMDEPFGSLDALTRDQMGGELLKIWGIHHKTVIMVTHDIHEAAYLADRVLVLSSRPAKIVLDLHIDLPRPRKERMRYTPEFGVLARTLRDAISNT